MADGRGDDVEGARRTYPPCPPSPRGKGEIDSRGRVEEILNAGGPPSPRGKGGIGSPFPRGEGGRGVRSHYFPGFAAWAARARSASSRFTNSCHFE